MAAYYNEIDKQAAEWLRELIKDDLIAPGDVDERSIVDVKADDLKGYTQCHFFAGIGIWSAALRLAGVPDDRPVWSGSCPCQGYSLAGKGKGASEDRDLWPVFAALIRECHPTVVFGEQVEAAIGFGWLDRLRADMEAEAYAIGSVVLGAHSVCSDNIRQRLYWVADSKLSRTSRFGQYCGEPPHQPQPNRAGTSGLGGVADSQREGSQGQPGDVGDGHESGWFGAKQAGPASESRPFNLWNDAAWWPCRDGKWRRVPARRVGHATSRQDDRREPRDLAEAQGQRGCLDNAAHDSSQDGRVADTEHDQQRQRRGARSETEPRDEPRIEPCGCGCIGRIPDAADDHGRRGERGPEKGIMADDLGGRGSSGGSGTVPATGHDGLETESSLLALADAGARPCEGVVCSVAEGEGRTLDREESEVQDQETLEIDWTLFPLSENDTGRTGALKGAGNAINLGTATAFIMAHMEATS